MFLFQYYVRTFVKCGTWTFQKNAFFRDHRSATNGEYSSACFISLLCSFRTQFCRDILLLTIIVARIKYPNINKNFMLTILILYHNFFYVAIYFSLSFFVFHFIFLFRCCFLIFFLYFFLSIFFLFSLKSSNTECFT